VRRIVLASLLGTYVSDIPPDVPYLRPLAIGQRGEEVLREIRRCGSAPILSRTSQIAELPETAQRVFRAECRAGEVYALTLPAVPAAGAELSTRMFSLNS
jgi:hypothetical protein